MSISFLLIGSFGSRPIVRSCRKRLRTLDESSPAAFLVKVRPRISSGFTMPLATNQRTRALMVSVFPEPAPAITTVGPRCNDSMIGICSSLGPLNFGSIVRSASPISFAEYLMRSLSIIYQSPSALVAGWGKVL